MEQHDLTGQERGKLAEQLIRGLHSDLAEVEQHIRDVARSE
jgi:hypothetical protein